MQAFDFGSFTRRTYRLSVILTIILGLFTTSVCAEPNTTAKPSPADIIHQAVAEGKLAYKLTTPGELKALLGEPQTEEEKDGGGMIVLDMFYPDVRALFGKSKRDDNASFKLMGLLIKGSGEVDIGGVLKGQRQVVVRNIDDFHEIGLRNVNLKNLDLSGEGDYLKGEDFDSLTQWPGPEKLPDGFDPKKLLEEGKNPGLGIRALHKEGINGEGIGIAILDQPLLLGHEEYSSRLIRYDATKASWMKPQMHGSPIIGIAVGKKCGVAPRAFVFYYAAPTTIEHQMQADYIDEIIKYNETAGDPGRIRVISISASPEGASNNDAFRKAHKKAQDAGILVVTCSEKFLRYGTLTLIEGKDPDNPESYKVGRYVGASDVLLIPAGNKTIATHQGINVYKYEREGGMSWAAPYIAGLAALAFQVNPDVHPQTIVERLVETATHTKIGPVVNPREFIKSIKGRAKAKVEPVQTGAETKSVSIVDISEASTDDRSSPEATVISWTKAAATGNVKDALACMLPGGTEYDGVCTVLNAEPSSGKYPVKKMLQSIDIENPIILVRQLTGDKASIGWECYVKEDVIPIIVKNCRKNFTLYKMGKPGFLLSGLLPKFKRNVLRLPRDSSNRSQ